MKTIPYFCFIALFIFSFYLSNAQLSWQTYQGAIPENAVEGGLEEGAKTYICLVNMGGVSSPGIIRDGLCYFENGGNEQSTDQFQVLVQGGQTNVEWVMSESQKVPANAFVVGNNGNAPFYIGRTDHTDEQSGATYQLTGKIFEDEGALVLEYVFKDQLWTWENGFYFLTEVSGTTAMDSQEKVMDTEEDSGGGGIFPLLLLAAAAIGAFLYFRKKKQTAAPVSMASSVSSAEPIKKQEEVQEPAKAVATKDEVNQIKILVSEDELDGAIDKLLHLLKEKSSEMFNEIIMYNSQLKDLDKQIEMQTIGRDQANIEKNRIKRAILKLLDNLAG